MGKKANQIDVVQTQRNISIRNAVEKYRITKWSDDSIGIPTLSNITTDDYENMKILYLKDLTDRGNQRVYQEDTEKDPIDLLVGYVTSLRDKLKRGTSHLFVGFIEILTLQ